MPATKRRKDQRAYRSLKEFRRAYFGQTTEDVLLRVEDPQVFGRILARDSVSRIKKALTGSQDKRDK